MGVFWCLYLLCSLLDSLTSLNYAQAQTGASTKYILFFSSPDTRLSRYHLTDMLATTVHLCTWIDLEFAGERETTREEREEKTDEGQGKNTSTKYKNNSSGETREQLIVRMILHCLSDAVRYV